MSDDTSVENTAADSKRLEAPCGCFRAVVKRMRPKFSDEEETRGQPILDAAGGFTYEESEDIEEGYCAEHGQELNRRQLEVQRMLAAGEDPEQAMLLMSAPLFALEAPKKPSDE